MLNLYNTFKRQKEPFVPLTAGEVGMYVCGVTVYDVCHVGHGRVMIVYDLLYRHLLSQGYRVKFVRNITDIDDKIINRAAQNNESPAELSQRYIDLMHEDERALNVLEPTHEPRATQTIDGMISIISRLIDTGHAYAAANGDVFYSVKSFPDYGRLSGHQPDELRSGERVAVDENKRDPLDFVLWKSAKPSEPNWPSPWGPGRPGWHIECSAMSMELLGEQFDIHGGGMDLLFPHHENEIAQSEALTGKCLARYWIHNGLVRIDDEKMSKSLNNFLTVKDVLADYSGEEIRLFILSSHYRSPINYHTESLDAARAALRRFYTALRGRTIQVQLADLSAQPITHQRSKLKTSQSSAQVVGHSRSDIYNKLVDGLDADYLQRFDDAMNDDLNTPLALSVLHELAGQINKEANGLKVEQLANTLSYLGGQLGLLRQDADAALKSTVGIGISESVISAQAIEQLIEQRHAARNARDFAKSDQIRDELAQMSNAKDSDAANQQQSPLLPGTEKPRSLGDMMRAAEKQASETPAASDQHSAKRKSKRPSRAQARRFARERALQALYQWEVSDAPSSSVKQEFLSEQDMSRVDTDYFTKLFDGVSHRPDAIDQLITPCLDRPIENLDPIERAVLRIATYELSERADIPARVVINEGIEVTKRFGADKGHRYVNGVLDKLALSLRPLEINKG